MHGGLYVGKHRGGRPDHPYRTGAGDFEPALRCKKRTALVLSDWTFAVVDRYHGSLPGVHTDRSQHVRSQEVRAVQEE